MSVKTLIDAIQPFAPSGYSRTGQNSIIKLIEQGVDELFDYDAPYMEYRVASGKGWPPFLITVAGTYDYQMVAANLSCGALVKNIGGTDYTVRARAVKAVFQDATRVDYGKRWIGSPYMYSYQNPYSQSESMLEVVRVPVDTWPATESGTAGLRFIEDPGASTDLLYVSFLWEPPRLTSESIPLVIPQKFEYTIEDFVIGRIQERANGDVSRRMERFRKEGVPAFRQWMGLSMGNMRQTKTTPREC